jgi:hypothetical protein
MRDLKPDATTEQLDDEIKLHQGQAAKMRPSLEKQSVMAYISRLRSFASAKRWLAKTPERLPKQ